MSDKSAFPPLGSEPAGTDKPSDKETKPMGFGKTMLASALGFLIGTMVMNVITFLVMIGFLVSAISSSFSSETESTLSGKNLAVELNLGQPVTECAPDELGEMTLCFGGGGTSIQQMLCAIDHAADDPRVNALYLHFGGGSLGWAQAEELSDALQQFKSSCDKPVIAYGEILTQPEYCLATSATLIAVHPSGMIDFRGMSAEVMYYKGLLDKLGVHMELIRPASCAYKSAGEVYTRTDMSDANREQIHAYISSIWDYALREMADRRGIAPSRLSGIADSLTGCLPAEALANRLIDTLCFEQDIRDLFKEQYNVAKIVSANRYAKDAARQDKQHGDRIALIYAEGDVVPGKNPGGQTAVYGDDIVKAFHEAAADDDVKAIVLRVNSPGGAVTASESMTHAIREAEKVKPVIVSMSGVAASAGYEISCFATRIVAHPATLTGSIGVFATLPEIGSMLQKHLGITTDTAQTNANSGGVGISRPLSPAARAMMQRNVEDFYVTFVQRVADGRGMSWEQVDEIARGRVWTGLQAKEIGLVDTLGGLSTALRIAAEESGIKAGKYSVVTYPAKKNIWEQIFSRVNESEETELRARLNQAIPFYDELTKWAEMEPLQARLPFAIKID